MEKTGNINKTVMMSHQMGVGGVINIITGTILMREMGEIIGLKEMGTIITEIITGMTITGAKREILETKTCNGKLRIGKKKIEDMTIDKTERETEGRHIRSLSVWGERMNQKPG